MIRWGSSVLAIVLISFSMLSAQAHQHTHKKDETLCKGFLPENNLRIPVGMESAGGVSETAFHNAIDKVSAVYSPIFTSKGATLQMEKQWENDQVNAQASRQGRTWKVAIWGGLARHQMMTEDGLALVVCHEVGHHIAGAPKVKGVFGTSWASNEGQSDYFGTSKCFRKAFRNENNAAVISAMVIPAQVTKECTVSLAAIQGEAGYDNELALCQRASMAGLALGQVLGSLGGNPNVKFDTPDKSQVTTTDDAHPDAQCRLDTYFAGAICHVKDTVDMIDSDARVGACNQGTDAIGFRPRCWYKPAGAPRPRAPRYVLAI